MKVYEDISAKDGKSNRRDLLPQSQFPMFWREDLPDIYGNCYTTQDSEAPKMGAAKPTLFRAHTAVRVNIMSERQYRLRRFPTVSNGVVASALEFLFATRTTLTQLPVIRLLGK